MPAELPQLPGVRHRHVDVGGARLHLAEAGEGPPLLLLHGWPQNWWCWRRLIGPLSETRRVLAPDLRGLGWSSAPPGDYAKQGFARDIAALLDAEGIERLPVIAHDWGGYTGFLLALEHAERVERLLALDVVPPWRQSGPPRLRELGLPLFASYQFVLGTPGVGPWLLRRSQGLVPLLIRAGSGDGMRWNPADLGLYASVLGEPDRARASSAIYRTFVTRELPASLRGGDRSAQLTVPTLLLMGGKSPLRRTIAPRAQNNLAVETVEGAGHFLPEEAPEAVLEAARRFLFDGG